MPFLPNYHLPKSINEPSDRWRTITYPGDKKTDVESLKYLSTYLPSVRMVKTIRISLDDTEHEKLDRIKGKRTWYDVLIRGIESIENWPREPEWQTATLDRYEEVTSSIVSDPEIQRKVEPT